MKVGILGSGDVAKALAGGFLKHGHQVHSARAIPPSLPTSSPRITARGPAAPPTPRSSASSSCLRSRARPRSMRSRPRARANLAGKPVIDATNPIAEAPPANGVLKFFTNLDQSLMERLQAAFPDAHFVKAFSSVGNAMMVNPQFKGGKPTMFICGNDDKAKAVVGGIIDQFGWETADMGKAEAARAIEPLCMLWCIPGFIRNEWTHAFKLLHRE